MPYILLWESVEAAATRHHHSILSVWDCGTEIWERASCFQLRLNLRVWYRLLVACLLQAQRIIESQKDLGYSLNQQCWIIHSRLLKRIAVNFSTRLSWDWSSTVLYLSNHPGIERLSKRYPDNVSYPKTRLAYSRLSRRLQPSILSHTNEVQAHLRSTLLSSVMVSDLAPHVCSIQRPISTMQALNIHTWSHSRHSSEPWIPTLHYLWICSWQHTDCHLSDMKLLGADATHPAPTQLNIWIYAQSVCEGRRLTAITVILRANLSFGGRCPQHASRWCTALGDK